MKRIFIREDGLYDNPLEIPKASGKQKELDSRAIMFGYAKDCKAEVDGVEYEIKVDDVLVGVRQFKAILVPSHEDVFRDTIRTEIRNQYRQIVNGRCPVPTKDGKSVRRCPLKEENPDYDPESTEEMERWIYNHCENCKYFNLDTPCYKDQVFSDLTAEDEDGNEEEFAVEAPIMDKGSCYERATAAITNMMREKHPSRAEDLALRFEGDCFKQSAEKTGKSETAVHKISKSMCNDILDTLDTIAGLEIDTTKYRR